MDHYVVCAEQRGESLKASDGLAFLPASLRRDTAC